MLLEEATSKQQVEEALAEGDDELLTDIETRLEEASDRWSYSRGCEADEEEADLRDILMNDDFLEAVIAQSPAHADLSKVPREEVQKRIEAHRRRYGARRYKVGIFELNSYRGGGFAYEFTVSLRCYFNDSHLPENYEYIPSKFAKEFWANLGSDIEWEFTDHLGENWGTNYNDGETSYVTASEEIFEEWCVELFEEYFIPTPESKVAFGQKTRAISKLKKQELPLKAGAFKKLFPREFEAVKEATKGRDFTPALLAQLIQEFGFKWSITESKYNGSQMLCSDGNEVLQFNIDITDPVYTQEQHDILLRVREVSLRSGHPVVHAGDKLFTVGWVRYCRIKRFHRPYLPGEAASYREAPPPNSILLVEEIQSDVDGVRKGLKDPGFVEELEAKGLDAKQIDEVVALMQPFADRFYEDALGMIFDLAEETGAHVEMLHYDQKRRFGSPRSIYTDLPKKMGMKIERSAVLSGENTQTWHYVPNRRRRRR